MKRLILTVAIIIPVCFSTFSQQEIKFSRDNCSIFQGKYDSIAGREAFTGTAILKDIEFSDGTIEWDLWARGGRSYAGVIFHSQKNGDSEEFYARPHKANGLLPDAFQYTPVYHGVSCWQLSHGPGGTQAAVIPPKEWIHFKLSVLDGRAVLTMFTLSPVTMQIDRLWHGDLSGSIGVKGPANGSAYFSNFTWSPEIDIAFPKKPLQHTLEPGIIRNWELSQPLLHNETNPYLYYQDYHEWKKTSTEKDGLVNLTKNITRNPGQPGWVYARTFISSDKEKTKKFQLAYSDYITVFVNGKAIMSSTNAYLSRDAAYAGLIGYFDEVFLPLKKGENEICLLIGEQFGGWGFKMRDGEAVRLARGLEQKWEIKHKLGFPESAAYDPDSDILYTSNFLTTSGGGISKFTMDGEILEIEWVKGLRSPTGIVIYQDNIFAVERTGLAIIDKMTGEIVKRIQLQGAVFPNDITVSEDGTLYISDSGGSKIYIIRDAKASVWMEGGELKNPNGIDYRNGKLYVGCTGDAAIKKIDIKTKNVELLASLPAGSILDGIQSLDNGSLLFSDFNGHLFYLDNKGYLEEILNTVSRQVNLADFEYIESKKLLIVPGLYSNVMGAYTFGK